MKKIIMLLCVTFFLSRMNAVRADYVLPYPSSMPGNFFYKISRVVDQAKSYWHWGAIASIKYHLGLSDKYLVEAKTLFEYKQYLLASNALIRSDQQLADIPNLLQQGGKNGEDMSQQRQIIHEAMSAHMAVIATLKTEVPKEFIWKPEKISETQINIDDILTASYKIRQGM